MTSQLPSQSASAPVRFPLALKLAVAMIVVVTLAVAAVSAIAIRREQASFKTELQQQADLLLDSLAASGADILYRLQVTSLRNLIGALNSSKAIVDSRVYDDTGRILVRADALDADSSAVVDSFGQQILASSETIFNWQAGQLVAGKAVLLGRQKIGAFSVALSTASLDVKTAALRSEGLLVAGVAILAGAVLSLLLSQSLTGPLRTLATATNRIAGGDLSQTIHIRTQDEFQELAGAFNTMVIRLRETIDSLKRRADELARSETKNRALIDALPDSIYLVDRAGTFRDAKRIAAANSSASLELAELFPEQIIGRLREVIDQAPHAAGVMRIDYETQDAQAQTHYFEVRITRSGAAETLLLERDITDRRRAEEDLRRAKEAAEAASQAKSGFLASMSHELRTPLNAMLGFTSILGLGMLKGASPLAPSQQNLLQKVEQNGLHLRDLINNVLDLAKIEAGHVAVVITEGRPHVFLEETISGMRSLALNKGISLDLHFAPEVPEVVLSDVRKLQQIVVNLVGNALKFTTTGGVTVEVCAPDPEKWQIMVRDTGVGMPPDAAQYIFEKFRQVDGTDQREYEGTGLGLAIVKNLVELLQGTISVESEVDCGSTFTLSLDQRLERKTTS